MRLVLATAAFVSLATVADAQAPQLPPRDYHVLGSGTINCATWTAESKQGIVRAQNQAWLLGYLTAFNRFGTDNTGDVMGPTSVKDAFAWFDDYCGKNAKDSVNKAAGALILELEGRKPPPPAPPEPPQQGIVRDVPPEPAAEPTPEPAKPAAKAPARRPAKKK
ncbi:MAG TPA: hypothetical protein VFN88_14210 [Caulobacteraceae bacterium]|nr:hypothetical protein [Caulobacteraceae bacterium]